MSSFGHWLEAHLTACCSTECADRSEYITPIFTFQFSDFTSRIEIDFPTLPKIRLRDTSTDYVKVVLPYLFKLEVVESLEIVLKTVSFIFKVLLYLITTLTLTGVSTQGCKVVFGLTNSPDPLRPPPLLSAISCLSSPGHSIAFLLPLGLFHARYVV